MFGISDTAARKELNKLTKLDIIKRKGEGRSTHYVRK